MYVLKLILVVLFSSILISLSTLVQEMMRVLHVGDGARDPWPSGKKFGNGGGNGNGGGKAARKTDKDARLGADWNEDW